MAVPKEERVVEIIVNGTKANASLKEMSAAAAVLSNQVAKIAADDPRRAELIGQLQTMRQRIGDARAEIAGLLTAEQQAAAAEQQLAASIAATAAEQERAIAAQQQAIVTGKSSTASYNEMKVAAGLLEKQLHELSADDPGRAALIADYQALKTRMGAARQEMEVTVKTEAQLRAEQDALRASQVQLVVNGQKVSASMREMREAAGQLEKELEELGQGDPARGPLIAALQELRARIKQVHQEVVGVAETTSRMKQVMTNAFAFAVGGGIEQGIEKVVEMGKSIFTTTAKFETYGKVLENALGSKSLSQKALADIQKMAAETPFSVDELTGSFLKFVNRGLQPSMAEMSKFGDLAASQGKSFDQLTEAVLDAGTGEFERLKEFGIGASKSGDQVTFSFKGVNQTVANTPEAIKGAILAMGELKGVAGGMAMIAEGLEGQLSNLGDTADQTAVEWGQSLRPVFVAVLSTLGFLLGMLKSLPGFIRENRGALLALAGAVLTFNAPLIQANALLVYNAALSRGKVVWDNAVAISTRLWTVAQQGLNLALTANPIGAVIALVVLLIGAIVAAYDKSERFRAAVQSLWRAVEPLVAQFKGLFDQLRPLVSQLQQMWESLGAGEAFLETFGYLLSVGVVVPLKLFVMQVQLAVDALTGLWDVGKRVANFFGADFKIDPKGSFNAFVENAKKGSKSIVATLLGQDEALAESAKNQGSLFDTYAHAYQQRLDAALKARLAAEAGAQLESLKLEEAALRRKLAQAKEGSEAEMRLKQQLVTNEAAQQLANEKKTAGDRAIILAEAEQKRVKLAQEFYEKQAKEAKAAREKAAQEALKARLAEIEAEKTHKEMLAQVKQASVAGRGDEQVTELSKIYTEGQLKIAALEATTQKEIAQLTGSAEQKRRRTLDLEQKLAADVALVRADVFQKQQDQVEKNDQQTYKQWQEEVDHKITDIEEASVREQAALEAPFHASLQLQQQYDELRYQARQAAFEKELTLIESVLGHESAEYKKVATAMEKDQRDHNKRRLANEEQTARAKRELAKLEMRTAGDVLSFGLELLTQDEEARKKHHSLYTALAAAKIIIDGTKEVQQIWEYSAENPANGLTGGAAGIAIGTIQTALAIGRTALALSKIGAGGGGGNEGGGSYWAGGATGKGDYLAVSPMGMLLQMSGMSVGSNGRLLDGSGFAVAGVVHEDEYVIPKWQLANPQVAAVAQWLEARRLRGFDGGGHTSASSGAALPVAAASPSSDGEKLYAVLTQLLDVNRAQAAQLADVKQWQRDLNVRLDLRATQSGLDEYKQVQQASAIRSKK